MTSATVTLTTEQIDELGRELDALKQRVVGDLGQEDRDYIYNVIKAQRALEVAGRASFYLGFLPPFWLAGVAALSLSKILDNMEIGHNVMHGQYDWMRDPALNSKMFEWDTACPSDQWRHSHNYMHHTYTNILGKDRDIGYGLLRMDESQKWNPYYLGNPVYAFALMTFFQYGVALHDLEAENLVTGRRKMSENTALLNGIWRKIGKQTLKDYVLFPALTGPLFVSTLAGNATANLVRNVWAYSIIFCGHFPSGVATFTEEETADESRGAWYVRQMMGSANITGSKLFHVLSGNLSHQIEHHLFPDIPARRYPQIAAEVQALCEKYGLPYNTGRFSKQIGSTWAKIFRLALPFGTRGQKDTPPAVTVVPKKVPVAA
ncbi:MAG: NADPH-dependent stearoyl-CoA 9-desaturase [Pseudonocardiales bacterium]|jgi:fatty acid desaturase|nr:acyl-CoA desaturase [Pseudonocardiales bacterium]MDT4959180.1 NADPH-dependent stearoyl-CoA 9-desaturase [Pseudonocardiales bacterium]MDT4960449.1 NADPH-dependent stearoyl-CoA 9-desaturase [Pseudonocardiales bacterium]MDT4971692.1 NADPH-dependent stearoyl-CoA 9-desaturase [Pseudonocardiales bacterium]MDT4980132.1 NADPH-dependent stearoyl-CoA 9-desaturase [Pseudonocardiales bacterium]